MSKRFCSICLDDQDTKCLMNCSKCNIIVHAHCYGIEENASSDNSSSSDSGCETESWRCAVCLQELTKPPFCELCPQRGGLYRPACVGKWVHLICSMTIPISVVREVISGSLSAMCSPKWNSRACTLCFDHKLAYTGVCIVCDVGSCQVSFHATCAHAAGLLYVDERINQPFVMIYAKCQSHSNKMIREQRIKNYNAIELYDLVIRPQSNYMERDASLLQDEQPQCSNASNSSADRTSIINDDQPGPSNRFTRAACEARSRFNFYLQGALKELASLLEEYKEYKESIINFHAVGQEGLELQFLPAPIEPDPRQLEQRVQNANNEDDVDEALAEADNVAGNGDID